MTSEKTSIDTPHTPGMAPPTRKNGPGGVPEERPGPSPDSPHVSGPHPPFAPPEERIESVDPHRAPGEVEKPADVE